MNIESSGGDESQNDCTVYKNIETPPEITMVKQAMPLSSKESCNCSTMGFFFKANAKSLLSNVKRALESKEEEGEEQEEKRETKGENIEKEEEKGKREKREQEENDSQIINARIRPVRKSGRVKVSHGTREELLINLVDDDVIIADRSDSDNHKIIDLSVDAVYQATAPLLTHRKKDKYHFSSKQQHSNFKTSTDDNVIDPLLMELAGRKTLSNMLPSVTGGEFKVRFANYNASLSMKDAGNCHLYPIQPDETIWKVYKTHCQINSLDYHKVELLYGGLKIYPSATLATLGEGLKPIVDIVAVKYADFEKIQLEEIKKRKQLLELVSFGNDDTDDANNKTTDSREIQSTMATMDTVEMINFGIRMAGIDESLKVSFSSDQPLRVLLDILERDGHIKTGERTRTRLLFDGDTLCLEKTPQDLQLEDGDLLEIGLLKSC